MFPGVAIALAYFVTAQLGFQLAFVAEQVTTVWAPTGIAIAALLLWGRRFWPAIWVGAFLANAVTDAPVWTALVIASGNTLEAVVASWALRRRPLFDPGLVRSTDALAFIVVAAFLATTISATLGVSALCLAEVQPWSRFVALWFDWWLGDAMGALIVAPAILTVARAEWSRGQALRAALYVLGSATLTQLIFGQLFGSGSHPLEYAIFPMVVAAAVSGGPAASSLSVLSASAVSIWHTVTGAGPFAGPVVHQSLILLQAYMGVLAATALLLATAIAERRATERREREAAAELGRRVREQQTLLDVLPIGIGIATDRECRHIQTNRAFAATLGLSQQANASKTAPAMERPTNFRVLTAAGAEVPDDQLPMQIAAREGREVRDMELEVVHEDGRTVRLLEYAAPLVDDDGVPRGAVGAFVDVTAAHAAHATLIRSEERYRRIFDTAGVAIWEEDFRAAHAALERLRADGVDDLVAYLTSHPAWVDEAIRLVSVVDVNDASLRMFNAPDKPTLLASLEQIQLRCEVFRAALLALARGDRRFESEASLSTLDGRPLHVLLSMTFPRAGESFDSVLVSLADITDRTRAETALRQEVDVRTKLAQVGASLAGELKSDRLVQAITDIATELTEAELGAFYYDSPTGDGEVSSLSAFAGKARDAMPAGQPPRPLQIFDRADSVIRVDDVTGDSVDTRYGPFTDAATAHVFVRSYLAVPVIGRGGIVVGGLFFGHSRPAVFTEQHEVLATGVARWAAIALDNARLYQDAEEANRLKDEFLATLSHELRTPLNAVLGWAHMLREGTMEPAIERRAIESLERNARAQAQLVDDLLDVSRIVAGKLQVGTEAVDLGLVVTNAVDTVRAGVSAKGLNLQLRVPAEHRLMVTGDADRLQQIVWNLVSNAIKFTPGGGRIDVELQRVDGRAEIVVRDTGQGIAPSFQPHLFQRFRQMDASKTRVHGLGLGLSIVRHLTEAHGGTVTAESAGEGHGATFRVRLPLRAVEDIVPDVVARPAAADDNGLSGVRALIVDDDHVVCESLRDLLAARGADIVTAASAGEALHLLAEDRFDVLLADLGLPEQDGLALIRIVRGLPPQSPNHAIAAIAVSASAGLRDRDEALAAGFDWHLGRPIDADQLLVAVSTVRRAAATSAIDSTPSDEEGSPVTTDGGGG